MIRNSEKQSQSPSLQEGIDYTIENGLLVFTAHYLQQRGYCCHNGCRHCPYSDLAKEEDGILRGKAEGGRRKAEGGGRKRTPE